MVESVLAICLLILLLAILAYFYFREFKHQDKSKADLDSMRELFRELSSGKDSFIEEQTASQNKLLTELTVSQNKLLTQMFDSNRKSQELYLKHIQSLEKLSIPKQQEKIIDSIMDHIQAEPNQIEKDEEELKQEDFNEVFSRIPLNPNTKVAFEGDQLPEEILEN